MVESNFFIVTPKKGSVQWGYLAISKSITRTSVRVDGISWYPLTCPDFLYQS